MYITKKEARAQLPSVGERRMESPTVDETSGVGIKRQRPCVVVAVNPAHLWYAVTFDHGPTECYHVPRVEPRKGGRIYG